MSPLETMVRAYHAEKFGSHADGIWQQCPEIARHKAFKCMQAALRALCDADLSDELLTRALDETEDDGSDRHKFERGHFRTMVSIIAHSNPEEVSVDYIEEARLKGGADYRTGYLDIDNDNPFEAGTRSYEAWRLGHSQAERIHRETEATLADMKAKGIQPTMSADELIKLTRGD